MEGGATYELVARYPLIVLLAATGAPAGGGDDDRDDVLLGVPGGSDVMLLRGDAFTRNAPAATRTCGRAGALALEVRLITATLQIDTVSSDLFTCCSGFIRR